MAQITDLLKLFSMSLGLSYFICLVSYDLYTWLMRRPHTRWIRAKALILTALTIQVLNYLNYKNNMAVNISDKEDPYAYAKVLASQSVIDSGRLVICVFDGYMLHAVASPESAADWGDIAALAISLFTAITADLYYLHEVDKTLENINKRSFRAYQSWYVFSGIAVLVCTLILILFLVAAILAGETVRGMFTQRISSSRSSAKNNEDKDKDIEDKVMTSWVLCRVGNPQYFIARSILNSSTGLVVTVCIVFFVVKGTILYTADIVYHDDNWDWLRHTTFALQCMFVLVGWAVILLRWLSAVFYFGKFSWGSVKEICSVEDYWTRSICDRIHMYEIHQWRFARIQHRNPIFKAIIVWFEAKLKFLLYFLLGLQTLLVFFSKCCWLISEIILFPFLFIHKCVVKRNSSYIPKEYSKYEKVLELLCMPGEDPQSLWLANEKAFCQAQNRFNECTGRTNELKTLLEQHLHPIPEGDGKFLAQLVHLKPIVEYFPALGQNCWKITAVSLLKIITMLSTDQKQTKECVEAYKQAWELMTFPDEAVGDPISVAADKEFKKLDKEFNKLKSRATPNKDIEAANQTLQNLLQEAEQTLQAQKMLPSNNLNAALLDSKDWNVIAPSYNMYIVCNHIISTGLNGSRLEDKLLDFFGDVICDCLNKFLEALEKSCSKWMVDFAEDKIWEAIYLAGKAKTVLPECCNSEEAPK